VRTQRPGSSEERANGPRSGGAGGGGHDGLDGRTAHQLNNLLMAISAHARLATRALSPRHPACQDLAEIERVVQQAGALVRAVQGTAAGSVVTAPVPAPPPPLEDAASGETVLLVDDHAMVRRVVELALRQLGYRVLVARGGREAMAVSGGNPGAIDILITDLAMPEMNGVALATHLCQERPGLKVLFVSGFGGERLVGVPGAGAVGFLAKPFSPVDLARRLRALCGDAADAPRVAP
jgi:CheY-like chemotaxis protein